MAPVSFSHVVRFSSQDTFFKAESLCSGKADGSGTWKCAKEDMFQGRMEAEFQLERASYIGHIDIGNCGSAFIEILVGNSMWPQDKPFLTLIPSAMLMTPAECKSWTKTHTVRMFSQSSFSKQTIESQWDRIRIICCQPYRKDKQFGLSFIRVASAPKESLQSCLDEDVLQTSSALARKVNDTSDVDGVMKLKKASGLMGCLWNLDKSKSPEVPLNRAGKMVQAALDSRSPTFGRHKPRIETSSSNPRSPYRKRTSQSSSEGPTDKRKKSPKRSLAGDIHDELELFLEEIDFTKIDLEQVTFKDLRTQMELQRGCALTKHEKEVFLKMVKAAIEKSVDGNEVHEMQEPYWSNSNKHKHNLPKHKDKMKKMINQSCNKLPKLSPEEMVKDKVPSPNPSHASVSLSPVDKAQITKHQPDVKSSIAATDVLSDDELPEMLYSPKKNKPGGTCQKTEKSLTTKEDVLEELPPVFIESSSTATFLVECPICSRFFPRSEVEFHAALCTGLSMNAGSSFSASADNTVPCPVCTKLFPSTEIEQHADSCAESSICADDSNFARELISIS